jgi:hypothetical protein
LGGFPPVASAISHLHNRPCAAILKTRGERQNDPKSGRPPPRTLVPSSVRTTHLHSAWLFPAKVRNMSELFGANAPVIALVILGLLFVAFAIE